MKRLWVAIIAVTILVSIVVAGKIYTRSIDEAAFAQLPANYQEIPVYPNAQNVWRGAVWETILRYNTLRITTFTTPDSTDKVMDFYRTTLENSGWEYDTHGNVTLGCTPRSSIEGDFYANAQNDQVWVAAKTVGGNMEYQIFKVSATFWQYGECP